MGYDWPGNVRELENFIERALIQSSGQEVDIDPLFEALSRPPTGWIPEISDQPERFPSLDEVCAVHMRKALRRSQGKISGPGGAADLLNLHPNTLRQRMDKFGVAYKQRSRRR